MPNFELIAKKLSDTKWEAIDGLARTSFSVHDGLLICPVCSCVVHESKKHAHARWHADRVDIH